jgi:hypothetical protein
MIIIVEKPKNYDNNGYSYFSPIQEAKLSKLGLPGSVIETLDRSLWATLSGDLVSKHLTVFEAAELAVEVEKYKKLPLIDILKTSLKQELGIVC